MSKIEVEETVEYEVPCPKDSWPVDPRDDCGECDHCEGEVEEGKTWYILCGHPSAITSEKRIPEEN